MFFSLFLLQKFTEFINIPLLQLKGLDNSEKIHSKKKEKQSKTQNVN